MLNWRYAWLAHLFPVYYDLKSYINVTSSLYCGGPLISVGKKRGAFCVLVGVSEAHDAGRVHSPSIYKKTLSSFERLVPTLPPTSSPSSSASISQTIIQCKMKAFIAVFIILLLSMVVSLVTEAAPAVASIDNDDVSVDNNPWD